MAASTLPESKLNREFKLCFQMTTILSVRIAPKHNLEVWEHPKYCIAKNTLLKLNHIKKNLVNMPPCFTIWSSFTCILQPQKTSVSHFFYWKNPLNSATLLILPDLCAPLVTGLAGLYTYFNSLSKDTQIFLGCIIVKNKASWNFRRGLLKLPKRNMVK